MPLQVPSPASEWQYGCAFFRRRKDPSIVRGYFQQSVAVISPLPYYSVLKKVVAVVAPLYFEHGESVLESAWNDICTWANPVLGMEYHLHLLGEATYTHRGPVLNVC